MLAATTNEERGALGMEAHDEGNPYISEICDGVAGGEFGDLGMEAHDEGHPPYFSEIPDGMAGGEIGDLGMEAHDEGHLFLSEIPDGMTREETGYVRDLNLDLPELSYKTVFEMLNDNDAPMTSNLPPFHFDTDRMMGEPISHSDNEPLSSTQQEFIEERMDHDDFASVSPPPPPPLHPTMVRYHVDLNASPPGSPSDQATVPSSPASEPDSVYRTPSTPGSQKQNRLKLSLDCALALFRTASLMQMSRSDLRDFTASFEAYKQFPCTAGSTWKAQDYRQKLKHALGERQVRTVRQNQIIRSFKDEAAVLAELQKSFPERTESGFDFQHIAAHLWKAIDISRTEAQRKRKSFIAPKFKSGLLWDGLAGESLVKLLVEEHRKTDLNSSVEKSWWFQKKAQVELLVFSHCKCSSCSLWHFDINSASPGMLELHFTRLRSEIYHAILTSHKYQEPLSRLKRDFPQLAAVDPNLLEEMHVHLHDTEECSVCQRRSTRMHRAAGQLESEESDEDSDEEDDDDNVGKVPKGTDGLVLAKVLMPLSADHYDDGDEGVETDDEEEEETNVENGVAQDTDVAALALDRLTLSSS